MGFGFALIVADSRRNEVRVTRCSATADYEKLWDVAHVRSTYHSSPERERVTPAAPTSNHRQMTTISLWNNMDEL